MELFWKWFAAYDSEKAVNREVEVLMLEAIAEIILFG